MVSVVFKLGHGETFLETADAASSVVDLFSAFLYPASNVPIVEKEISEEASPWELG